MCLLLRTHQGLQCLAKAISEKGTDNDVQYLVLADRLNNIDVAEAYKVIGSPTIVMVAPDGKILSYGHKIPDMAKWID